MASTSALRTNDIATYPALLGRVKATLLDGQRKIEQEKVRTYWQTGQLIQSHILKNQARAEHGREVLLRLAKDLDVDESLIRRCVEFARKYPRMPIHARGHELTWSHYRCLIAVADDKVRGQLEDLAGKSEWPVEELSARIKESREGQAADAIRESSSDEAAHELPSVSVAQSPVPLVALKGQLYTYQIIRPKVFSAGNESELLVDLGFSMGYVVEPRQLSSFSVGDVVASVPKEDAYRFSRADRSAKDLYTYKALVEKVIDGDTLKVRIDLGFQMSVRATLRLRGIDCPELGTPEGDRAKAFVQSLLKEADEIIIRSSRDDKYGRYLADVFMTSSTPGVGEVYLNNHLLDKGHAVRYGE